LFPLLFAESPGGDNVAAGFELNVSSEVLNMLKFSQSVGRIWELH
jgi:hypothetical protein